MIIFLKPMKIRHYRGFNTRDVAISTVAGVDYRFMLLWH